MGGRREGAYKAKTSSKTRRSEQEGDGQKSAGKPTLDNLEGREGGRPARPHHHRHTDLRFRFRVVGNPFEREREETGRRSDGPSPSPFVRLSARAKYIVVGK